MPVQHAYTMKAGTKSKLLLFYATSGDGTSGRTGLTRDLPAGTAAYIREGDSAATRVEMVKGHVGQWGAGALAEVDAELLPGVYQFGAPDEMIAEGSARAVLLIRFPDALVKPVEINLVAYDPQDAERIGVWSLAGHKRHEFLRQALPRFTEMELALGEQAEKELNARLKAEKEYQR
ncbi:MAG TPA: hypothetical protein VFA51_12135 [Candidatus Udaeobacter sp.]|nr:hypothetical protein [Candidatus Udaeobacter sp.]